MPVYKQVRLLPKEGGSYNGTTNSVLNFEIPQNLDLIDIEKSYVEFQGVELSSTVKAVKNTANEADVTTFPVGYSLPYGPVGFVRNTKLDIGDQNVSEVQDVGVLHANLDPVSMDFEYMQQDYLNGYGAQNFIYNTGVRVSPFNQFTAVVDSAPSVANVAANIRCPLRKLIDIHDAYPAFLGRSNLRMELMDPSQRKMIDLDVGGEVSSPITVIQGDGANGSTTFTSTANINVGSTYLCPGMKVRFAAADGSGNVVKTITSVSTNAGGKLEIDVSVAFTADVQQLFPYTTDTVNYSIQSCRLVVTQIITDQQERTKLLENLQEIKYNTWKLERFDAQGQAFYNRQYAVEPRCKGVVLLMPENNVLNSSQSNITSYRFRYNGANLTNVPIELDSTLHLDRFMDAYKEMNMNVKNLQTNKYNIPGTPTTCKSQLATPLFGEPAPSTVNIDANCSAAMNPKTMFFYKCIEKAIVMKDGMFVIA